MALIEIPTLYGSVRADYTKPKGCTEVVIFIPGASGGALSARFLFISRALMERGIGCLKLEFSFYNSDKELSSYSLFNLVEELKNAVDFLKMDGIDRIGLTAKSFSGIVGVMGWKNFDSMVLIAPTVFIKQKDMKDVEEIFEKPFNFELRDVGFSEAYLEEMDIPIRFIHGTEDKVVDLSNSEILIDLCKGNLVVIVGADHSFYTEDHKRDLGNKVAEWFEHSL